MLQIMDFHFSLNELSSCSVVKKNTYRFAFKPSGILNIEIEFKGDFSALDTYLNYANIYCARKSLL